MDIQKTINRIQKLRRLAEGTDSEAEASAALAAIQKLLLAADLDEAELQGADEAPEDIGEADPLVNAATRTSWRGALAGGLARANGCRVIWAATGGRLRLFGRPTDCARVHSLYSYSCGVIDAMASRRRRTVPPFESPRAYLNAYRYGAACAISEAVRKAAGEEAGARPKTQGRALVVQNVDDYMRQAFPRSTTRRAHVTSAAGMAAGRADGAGAFGPTQLRHGGRLALGSGS